MRTRATSAKAPVKQVLWPEAIPDGRLNPRAPGSQILTCSTPSGNDGDDLEAEALLTIGKSEKRKEDACLLN